MDDDDHDDYDIITPTIGDGNDDCNDHGADAGDDDGDCDDDSFSPAQDYLIQN